MKVEGNYLRDQRKLMATRSEKWEAQSMEGEDAEHIIHSHENGLM